MKEKWEIKKLGECFDIIRNGANIKQYDNAEGVPITRIETLANDTFNRDRLGYANIHDTDRYRDYFLKNNDILISHINSTKYLGRAVLYKKKNNENIIHGMNLLILSGISSDILPKFIFYYFKTESYRIQIYKITKKAVNQASFTTTALKEVPIPIPPLPVQEAIVKELDTLHRLKELQEQQLAEYDTLAQATFYDMFGDPIENEKGWEKIKCEKLFDIKLGKMLSAKNYKGTHLKPYLRNVNIKWGELDLSDIKEMDFFDSEFEQYKLRKGDILVCEGGEVGRTAIYNGEIENCCYQNALHRLRIIDEQKIKREYFLYFMLIGVPQGLIKKLTISVTIQHFALVKFKKMEIPIPPLSLQTQFAERIEKIEAQKQLVKQGIAETQTLIDYTMDKYFG